ncbi:unnamed protein product [Owenia fusiformis]|uniref:BRICHOS domain-containing protein n=1 Tax=Owenia fusiformis TaxID=6347 RepID=A0A8S4N207_OWEFU|nr:unnamed protein product [Owenia fusiformis]
MKPDISIVGKETAAGDTEKNFTTEHMPAPSPVKTNTKKYTIVGVSVVLVVLIVVGSLVGAMHMIRETHEDLIKEYSVIVKGGKDGESAETVKVDKEKRTTEIDDPKQHSFVLHDFNKGLTVVRTRMGNIYGCFLSTIDKEEMSPEAVESYMEAHPDGTFDIEQPKNDSSIPRLMPSEEPVAERGFLSDAIREACDEIPLHWLVPVPEELINEHMNTDISKRSTRFKRGCGVHCSFQWVCCPWRRAYYCGVRCSWSWGKR